MSQTNVIKPLEAYGGLPEVDVVTRGTAVVTNFLILDFIPFLQSHL